MSAHLFKVGGVWHYRFQVAGRRVQRSTRERGEAKARRVAEAAHLDAVTRSNGGVPVPTLGALFADWLAVQGPVSSRAHVRSVEVVARLHLGGLADMPITTISGRHIELARNAHLDTHAPASVNHWLRVLKLVVLWSVRRGTVDQLPWRVTPLKVQKRPRSTLPLDAAMAWLAAVDAASAREPGTGTAVRLMFGLGLREGEAAGARWEWIDWQRKTYTPGETKGREAEPVPLPDWLVLHLRGLAIVHGLSGLIAPRRDGTRFGPGFARRAMHSANEAMQLQGITPHRLRGTFATLLSEAGVPIQTIQAVLRHKSPLTTMAYLEKNMDTTATAQAAIAEKTGLAHHNKEEK